MEPTSPTDSSPSALAREIKAQTIELRRLTKSKDPWAKELETQRHKYVSSITPCALSILIAFRTVFATVFCSCCSTTHTPHRRRTSKANCGLKRRMPSSLCTDIESRHSRRRSTPRTGVLSIGRPHMALSSIASSYKSSETSSQPRKAFGVDSFFASSALILWMRLSRR